MDDKLRKRLKALGMEDKRREPPNWKSILEEKWGSLALEHKRHELRKRLEALGMEDKRREPPNWKSIFEENWGGLVLEQKRHEDVVKEIPDQLALTPDTQCWFCGRPIKAPDSAFVQSVYKIIKRRTGITGCKTSYVSAKVCVPRCQTCEDSHVRLSLFSCLCGLVGLVIGYELAGTLESTNVPVKVVGAIFVGAITAFLARSVLDWLASGPRKPQSYVAEFPALKQLSSKGWSFGEKPPYKGSDVG